MNLTTTICPSIAALHGYSKVVVIQRVFHNAHELRSGVAFIDDRSDAKVLTPGREIIMPKSPCLMPISPVRLAR
jgi:hypothetical protein